MHELLVEIRSNLICASSYACQRKLLPACWVRSSADCSYSLLCVSGFHVDISSTQDVRVSPADWPSIKPTTPFGQIPTLKVGDIVVAESAAIGEWTCAMRNL